MKVSMRILAVAMGLWALVAGVTHAADRPVVVELYTSQGCSSCPPADKILAKLADREDVIALAFHVDYWDYIGWKDKFADPSFTQRQRNYARVAGARSIYTPQMIVHGKDHVIGAKPMELADHISNHRSADSPVSLRLSRNGDIVRIRATSKSRFPGGSTVRVATYSPEETVAIKRGENAGRELTYHNVVTEWALLAKWDGIAPMALQAEMAGDAPGVVIVQNGAVGPILAAQKID